MIRLLFFLSIVSLHCQAQENDLDFLIQKIKVNYPGYQEKTKGTDFDKVIERAINENRSDSFKMMATIVDFFRDRHLDLFKMKSAVDTSQCDKDYKTVRSYFRAKQHKQKYEGFWVSEANHCVLAIKQTNRKPLHYIGYVIECRDSSVLYPGMAFFDIEQKDTFLFTRATSSSSGLTFYVRSEFRNDSVLTTGPYNKWKRLPVYEKPILNFRPEAPKEATGRWLGMDSYLITIPSSTARNGQLVDSLLKADSVLRNHAKNLIVDIRNNTGGKVAAYEALLPLLYTNPILKVNSSLYCTDDDADIRYKDLQEYIAKGGSDTNYINYWNDIIKMQRQYKGQFIDFPWDTLKFKAVLPQPQKIGIIINYGCQSAAEIFLLNAKQSKKVTLFGEHTMGAIDYLDYYPVSLPSGKYKLYIATTRRQIPPGGSKLDGVGIAPDVSISDREPDWVDFVKKYYERH